AGARVPTGGRVSDRRSLIDEHDLFLGSARCNSYTARRQYRHGQPFRADPAGERRAFWVATNCCIDTVDVEASNQQLRYGTHRDKIVSRGPAVRPLGPSNGSVPTRHAVATYLPSSAGVLLASMMR